MVRSTIMPMKEFANKPAFWGFERDLKDVLDGMETAWSATPNKGTFYLKETDQAFLLSFDMPGVSSDDLNISLEGQVLKVYGERKSLFDEQKEGEVISKVFEIPKGSDREKIQAHISNGVVYIAMPKMEKEKAKSIKVSDEFSEDKWSGLLKSNK